VVEGYVLMPKVLGKSMGLHSVVVLASFMIFGSALGMFGLLLALPLMSVVVIVARELVLPALRELAEARGAKKA
jgi:predicted PurR-regulated permease PerM